MQLFDYAPDFDHIGLEWFNVSQPLTLSELRGRIVILDFWTFCCVNCIHTLSTLRRIEERFGDDVVVIGVHSPKFTTERDSSKVADAIRRHDIRHPVIHDPHAVLWDEYAVHAWPTLIVVSPDGRIVERMSGEPDTSRLIGLLDGMLCACRKSGMPKPFPLPFKPPRYQDSYLLFPGKIKAAPDRTGTKHWALTDSGHHRIVLFDDDGGTRAAYGDGTAGFVDGPPCTARFNSPQGLIATPDFIFVADTGNHAVRRIDRSSGMTTTLVGTGERGMPLRGRRPAVKSALASPWDLEYRDGTLYIANAGTHQIGLLTDDFSTLALLAGNSLEGVQDGPAEDSALAQTSGLALSIDGNVLFMVDSETSSLRALRLADDTPEHASVETLIGHGLFTFGYRDGSFSQALLQHPMGLAVADAHTLFVTDSYNDCLRRVSLARGLIETIDCPKLVLREPAGLACDGPSRLLICDTGMHRVIEWNGADRSWKVWRA